MDLNLHSVRRWYCSVTIISDNANLWNGVNPCPSLPFHKSLLTHYVSHAAFQWFIQHIFFWHFAFLYPHSQEWMTYFWWVCRFFFFFCRFKYPPFSSSSSSSLCFVPHGTSTCRRVWKQLVLPCHLLWATANSFSINPLHLKHSWRSLDALQALQPGKHFQCNFLFGTLLQYTRPQMHLNLLYNALRHVFMHVHFYINITWWFLMEIHPQRDASFSASAFCWNIHQICSVFVSV